VLHTARTARLAETHQQPNSAALQPYGEIERERIGLTCLARAERIYPLPFRIRPTRRRSYLLGKPPLQLRDARFQRAVFILQDLHHHIVVAIKRIGHSVTLDQRVNAAGVRSVSEARGYLAYLIVVVRLALLARAPRHVAQCCYSNVQLAAP
jgi:hypothetical protein